MPRIQRIAPCLWFDDQAEEAATFYTSIFAGSRIVTVSRYGEAGREVHGRPPGSVMTVAFELDGQPFTALNGGPVFRFNEAISFQVACETQAEVDHYWERLSAGGDPKAQQCGLAQGPVRRLVADRAQRPARAARPARFRGIPPGLRGDADDEEARHRGPDARLRRPALSRASRL
jgi:predicted 3-demethylubiquinone-9 3-methyltransferase (glyoxalase superfamily)